MGACDTLGDKSRVERWYSEFCPFSIVDESIVLFFQMFELYLVEATQQPEGIWGLKGRILTDCEEEMLEKALVGAALSFSPGKQGNRRQAQRR